MLRNKFGDILCDLALHCQNIGKLSIIGLGPSRNSGGGIDEMDADAHSIANVLNTAEQKLPGVRSLLDACSLDVLRRQSSDNLASDSFGEISVGFLLAQILKR